MSAPSISDAIDAAKIIYPPAFATLTPTVNATPYACRPPSSIPERPWIYGRHLLRGSMSLLVAPGATGKTAMLVGAALAMVTGRPLLGKPVHGGTKRVWLWNLEDSGDEIARLIEAARLHWRIGEEDIGDRLFVDSGLDGAELKVAVEDRGGFRIVRPLVEALVAELKAKRIDVLIIDPFVSSHSVSENDNMAMDAVAKEWSKVAVEAGCAILLAHHTRKLGGAEANAESARGAGALVSAARSVIALNRVSEEEASRYNIDREMKRRFFRAYDDKNNRTPPADASDWYRLESVCLGNGKDGGEGDNIQVVVPWAPPGLFDSLPPDLLFRLQRVVRDAGPWKYDPQAEDWIGVALAKLIDVDISDRTSANARRVKAIINTFIREGGLKKVIKRCEKARRDKPFVEVGNPAEPPRITSEAWGDAA